MTPSPQSLGCSEMTPESARIPDGSGVITLFSDKSGWVGDAVNQTVSRKRSPISVGSVTHSLAWVEASGGQHRRDCWGELLHASCGNRGMLLKPIQDQLPHV